MIVSLLNHQIIIQIIGQFLTGETNTDLIMSNKLFKKNDKNLSNLNGLIFQFGLFYFFSLI